MFDEEAKRELQLLKRITKDELTEAQLDRLPHDVRKIYEDALTRLPKLRKFQKTAAEMWETYSGGAVFTTATRKSQPVADQVRKLSMQLKLARTLNATDKNHEGPKDPEVTIVFIDAQMEHPVFQKKIINGLNS